MGLSNSVLKLIEKRHRIDKWIAYAGMLMTIVIVYAFWRWTHWLWTQIHAYESQVNCTFLFFGISRYEMFKSWNQRNKINLEFSQQAVYLFLFFIHCIIFSRDLVAEYCWTLREESTWDRQIPPYHPMKISLKRKGEGTMQIDSKDLMFVWLPDPSNVPFVYRNSEEF